MNSKPLSRTSRAKRNCGGFTLIELLALLAVIAGLSLVFVPALARTQPNGKATQCLNNLRQFTAGWSMYAMDNRERVANDYGVSDTLNAIQTGRLDD